MKRRPAYQATLSLFLVIAMSLSFCRKEENENLVPACTITYPKSGQLIMKGEQMIIVVEAWDHDGSIMEVKISIDGMERNHTGTNPWCCCWNTSEETAARHLIKAIATDNAGAITEDQICVELIETSQPCPSKVTDTDGKVYSTVKIGNQCWMRENLNTGTMVRSENTGSHHSDAGDNGVVEKYCYNNDPVFCEEYGGLYDWDEAMGYVNTPGAQGICPEGWHIPTDEEWCTLTTYIDARVNCDTWGWSGKDAGGRMKQAGLDHWSFPNAAADNSSGFTALGAGYRVTEGQFVSLGNYALFWSSTESSSTCGFYRYLGYQHAHAGRYGYLKQGGLSVRCIKSLAVGK